MPKFKKNPSGMKPSGFKMKGYAYPGKSPLKGKKKKRIKVDPEGIAHIKSTFNNTIITLTDNFGNFLAHLGRI